MTEKEFTVCQITYLIMNIVLLGLSVFLTLEGYHGASGGVFIMWALLLVGGSCEKYSEEDAEEI